MNNLFPKHKAAMKGIFGGLDIKEKEVLIEKLKNWASMPKACKFLRQYLEFEIYEFIINVDCEVVVMTEFLELVKERRSASNFLPGYSISEQELNEIFEILKLAPSAFNLQHTNYIAVLDKEKKNMLHEAANGQYKILSSSAVIIVLGDKRPFIKQKKSTKV